MTIQDLIKEYGVTKVHLESIGLTHHFLRTYGETEIKELPAKWKPAVAAVLMRYGVDQEIGE